MRITGKLISVAVIALCVASCAKDTEKLLGGDGVPLQVTAVMDDGTKAGLDDTDFMENDQIGLFLTGYDAKYRNVKATGKGSGSGTAVTRWSLGQDVWLTKESATVVAYYPYDEKADWYYDTKYEDFYIAVNVADQTNYLHGYAKEVSGSNPKADITFRHAMARLRLQVSYFDEKNHLTEIRLSNVSSTGNIYLMSGTARPTGIDGITIPDADKMPLASEGIYDVLLLPQSAATATLTLTFSDGKSYYTSVSLPAMSSGDYNILPITVKRTSGPVTAGHDYVDLGLPSGTLWATCNVGASKPEDYGGYYAWGETEEKDYYDCSTYKYCKGEKSMTKYCNDSRYGYNGYTDNRTVLEPEDDVAHVKWGGDWRMPTDAEWSELRNSSNCAWTWYESGNAEFGGIAGYKVTSKKSGYTGKSIFLPAAGSRYYDHLYDVGSDGSYWSSSLYESNPDFAWCVYFNSGECGRDDDGRHYGYSVRPVCP